MCDRHTRFIDCHCDSLDGPHQLLLCTEILPGSTAAVSRVYTLSVKCVFAVQ